MKIAVALDGNACSAHFGRCQQFIIYEIRGGKIWGEELVKNPPHQHGYLPSFLEEHGVKVVMATDMGWRAHELFKDKRIEIITGVSGEPQKLINKYLQGELVTSGVVCNKHEFRENCE